MKTFILTLLLVSSTAFAHPETDARLTALEARITYLEKRIELLERDNKRPKYQGPIYYSCRISAFGQNFEVTEQNQGLARNKVRKACQAKVDGFFCQDSDVRCTELR